MCQLGCNTGMLHIEHLGVKLFDSHQGKACAGFNPAWTEHHWEQVVHKRMIHPVNPTQISPCVHYKLALSTSSAWNFSVLLNLTGHLGPHKQFGRKKEFLFPLFPLPSLCFLHSHLCDPLGRGLQFYYAPLHLC